MTTAQDLTYWSEGCIHLDNGCYREALAELLSMHIQTSKTRFNIALAYAGLDHTDEAIQMLSEALSIDTYFAMGFFQRGCIYFNQKRYQEALQDFKDGVDKLLGRSFIDYHQLGMRHKLQANHFHHNQSICQAMLGTDMMHKPATGLVIVPQGLSFRPPKNKVANMPKIDYLGKAKVVTALTPEDNFSGFSGPRRLEASVEIGKSHSAPTSPSSRHGDKPATMPLHTGATSSTAPSTSERGKLAVPSRDPRSKTPPARWSVNNKTKIALPPAPTRPMPMPPQRS